MKSEDNRKQWAAIQRREQARLRDLQQLKRFMEEGKDEKKTPKDLLKLAVYAQGIRAAEAADILGVRRAIVDAWAEALLEKKLVEYESIKHSNPLIKPSRSVLLKFRKSQVREQSTAANVKAQRVQKQATASVPQSPAQDVVSSEPYPSSTKVQQQATEAPYAPTEEKELTFEEGVTHLVLEDNPNKSVRMFIKEIRSGLKGLFITRANPNQVRKQYYHADAKVVWLTSVETGQDVEAVSGIQEMSIIIGKFIDENPQSVILIDGLEYLIINNGFQVVLRLVQQIRDKVSASRAKMIMPLSPEAVDGRQLSLLERDCQTVR